jgi:hypothetical protein
VTDIVKVAIIAGLCSAVPTMLPSIISVFVGLKNSKRIDGLYSEAHADAKQANKRADAAEAFIAGSDSERERK